MQSTFWLGAEEEDELAGFELLEEAAELELAGFELLEEATELELAGLELLEEAAELELAGLELLEEAAELELAGLELIEEAAELELAGLELLEEAAELGALGEFSGSLEEVSKPDEAGRPTDSELLADGSKSELSDEPSGSEEFNELTETGELCEFSSLLEFPEAFPILSAFSTLLQPESRNTPAASKADSNTLIFFILSSPQFILSQPLTEFYHNRACFVNIFSKTNNIFHFGLNTTAITFSDYSGIKNAQQILLIKRIAPCHYGRTCQNNADTHCV